MRRVLMAILVGVSPLGPASLWGAAGDLDPTFGVGGGVVTQIEEDHNSIVYDLARQPDGKLVAAGYAETHDRRTVVAVARYDAGGALDPTFGTGGVVLTPFGTSYPLVQNVLIQSDGKIVVVARVNPGSGGDIGLLRYDANGTLDATFGDGGVVITSLGGPAEDTAAAALQADDKIVVAADTSVVFSGPASGDVLVLRYQRDGALDTGFGAAGVATIDFGGRRDDVAALVVEPDGHLIVAGYSWDNPQLLSDGSSVTVARLEADGSLDASFGTAGTFLHDLGGQDEAKAIASMPDGTLLIGGASYTWEGPAAKNGRPFFLRLTGSGALDGTFGTGGVVWPTRAPLLDTLALTPDGKIVAIGFSVSTAFTLAFGIARYQADGSLDLGFGNAGMIDAVLDQTGSNALGGLVEPDGRIVVGGWAGEPSAENNPPYFIDYYFALARFLGDGAPCASDADCAACESCDVSGTCTFAPRTTCSGATPGGASFELDNPGIDRTDPALSFERHRVKFRWRGSTPLGFDPLTTDDVGFCLYAQGRRVLKSLAPAGDHWAGRPGGRLTYRDSGRAPNGIAKMRLSRSTVIVDGRGVNLTRTVHGFPNVALLLDSLPLLVQLHGGNGACLQAVLTDVQPKLERIAPRTYAEVGLRASGQ